MGHADCLKEAWDAFWKRCKLAWSQVKKIITPGSCIQQLHEFMPKYLRRAQPLSHSWLRCSYEHLCMALLEDNSARSERRLCLRDHARSASFCHHRNIPVLLPPQPYLPVMEQEEFLRDLARGPRTHLVFCFPLCHQAAPPTGSPPPPQHVAHRLFHPSLPQEQSRAGLAMGRLKDNSQSLPAGRVQLRNLSQEERRLERGGPGAETLPTLPDGALQRHHLPYLPFQVPFP